MDANTFIGDSRTVSPTPKYVLQEDGLNRTPLTSKMPQVQHDISPSLELSKGSIEKEKTITKASLAF